MLIPAPRNTTRRDLSNIAPVIVIVLACCVGELTAQESPARQVVLNEIAWMGTLASANDEWIELVNNTSSAINLTGWTLTAADGTPSIVLSGGIPAGGYFLLERTD